MTSKEAAHAGWLALLLLAGCENDIGLLLRQKTCPPGEPGCASIEPCTDTGTIACGLGLCATTVPACVDGVASICTAGASSAEICNDLDDDCDGMTDNGCDDDHDGYCDSAMGVIGKPKVCPLGAPILLDCDDALAERNPGHAEVCDDGLDNDCNDLTDYLDFHRCTPVTGTFQDGDGIVSILHGTTVVIRAEVRPPVAAVTREWVVTKAEPAEDCAAGDITMTEPEEQLGSTTRRIGIADDPAKVDCRYELSLLLDGHRADHLTLTMRNPRPRVNDVVGSTRDNETLVVRVASGRNPRLTAVVPADDDTPVVIEWAGGDAGLLDCATPCAGAEMLFLQPPAAGTYHFTLRARDSFDGRVRTRALTVEAVRCVWARASGTGAGTGPALAQAYGSLDAALADAEASSSDVCIAGGGTFAVNLPLVLPVGVGINGAFDASGQPSATPATLDLAPSAQLTFAPGYASSVRRLRIIGGGALALIDARDASPALVGLDLVMPPAAGARAIRLETTTTQATLRVLSTRIRADSPLDGATGIEIVGGSSPAALTWNGASSVVLPGCIGDCRGIAVTGNASASLTGDRVDVEAVGAASRAIAIEVAGANGRRASADIRSITEIIARTTATDPAAQTIAVRLFQSEGVHVDTNDLVGAKDAESGTRFSAGIADGEIRRDGSYEQGGSTNLTIRGNRQIVAGRSDRAWTLASCSDPIAVREGTDVAAGILLVGTTSVAIENNGNNASRDNGIFGGASSSVWDPGSRAIPPSVPAIWIADTTDVRVVHNEIRSGVLSTPAQCAPAILPPVVAFEDGLPNALLRSRNLVLDSNGVVTGRRTSFDAVPALDRVGAHLLDLRGSSVRAMNNYLAVTRGTDLAGVYARGTVHVELWNNVIELEAITSTGAAVEKRAIVLDAVPAASVDLINNIVVVWENAEDAPTAIAIDERSDHALGRLRHNLLFVEAAERLQGAYVRSAAGVLFTRTTFYAYTASLDAAGNRLVPPLFQSRRLEHWRSQTHLSEGSPARDAGQLEGAPALDRFGHTRPTGAGVDIGYEETVP